MIQIVIVLALVAAVWVSGYVLGRNCTKKIKVQVWQVPPLQDLAERAAWREYWVHHQEKLLGEFEL